MILPVATHVLGDMHLSVWKHTPAQLSAVMVVCLAGLKDELSGDISRIIQQGLVVRDGLNVPSTGNLPLEGGLRFDATVLYADLIQSAKPVTDFQQRAAAKVVRMFLRCMCRLITSNGGTVTSFDGKKVMGVFLGDMRNTNAATCALKMNYVTSKMIAPTLEDYFTNAKESSFSISHCVGVDTGSVMAVRAGLSGLNDLVWVGRAPNLAAKLSEIRTEPHNSYISEDVFFMLFEQAKFSPENDNQLMWEESHFDYLGESMKVYRSAWWREP